MAKTTTNDLVSSIVSVLFRLRLVLLVVAVVGAAYAYGAPEVRFEIERMVFAPASRAAEVLRNPVDAVAFTLGWKQDVHPSLSSDQSAH